MLWTVSALSCLLVTVLSVVVFSGNIRNEIFSDLKSSSARLIQFGLKDLTVFDEHEKLPSILRGVLSISRSYRIIRIFDEFGILMYSNFPHDEVRFLDEDLLASPSESLLFFDPSKNHVSFSTAYKLSSGERRLLQMSQALPPLRLIVVESLTQYSLIFLVLLVSMFLISSYIAGRLMRPIKNLAEDLKALRERDVKTWRTLPEQKDSDFLDGIVTAINKMISRVQTSAFANHALARFVAHEVRTPLTVMLGEIDTSKFIPMDENKYQEMLKTFSSDIKKIDQIINSILLIAQRDREQHPHRPFPMDLKVFLNRVVDDFFKIHQVKVPVVISQNLPMVLLDPDLCSLLLDNLLRNCIKHGGVSSSPEIHVKLQDSQYIVVEIQDKGPGMPESVVSEMNQADPIVPSHLGIGLRLCKEICHLTQINIRFENRAPGLNVRIQFPVARSAP